MEAEDMWRRILVVLILLQVGCSAAGASDTEIHIPVADSTKTTPLEATAVPEEHVSEREETLINFGPAPELTNQVWINTPEPLRLADLRGKVVLLEMWTFG
jgi:hypothetical protein